MPDTFDDWLAAVPEEERPLAGAVLGFVRETLEDSEETMKWNQPCFVVAGSNGLYVSTQSGYVNLGFYEGDGARGSHGTARRDREGDAAHEDSHPGGARRARAVRARAGCRESRPGLNAPTPR